MPYLIAQSGNTLYTVDESRHSLLTINKNTAQVGTLVNSSALGGHGNGSGSTQARFNGPRGIAAAPAGAAGAGTLYVADSGNHRIRRVRVGDNAATTQVSDLAGSGTPGHNNAAGAAAQFRNPIGIAVNQTGTTLYVADTGNHRIRAVNIASGAVSDLAGSSTTPRAGGFADGAGAGAQFKRPAGLALSGTTLYVADSGNHRIRAIDLASKAVSTIAGSGTAGFADLSGKNAQFNTPVGIAINKTTLYVVDNVNHRIRAIDLTTSAVTTIAGNGKRGSTNGIGTKAPVSSPIGIAASGSTLYVSSGNLIRKLEYKDVK